MFACCNVTSVSGVLVTCTVTQSFTTYTVIYRCDCNTVLLASDSEVYWSSDLCYCYGNVISVFWSPLSKIWHNANITFAFQFVSEYALFWALFRCWILLVILQLSFMSHYSTDKYKKIFFKDWRNILLWRNIDQELKIYISYTSF